MTGVTPHVEIVLLNWNKSASTLACVEALRKQSYRNAHILVVDNGSAEADVMALVAAQADFELLRNPRNFGFTGGVNIGIAQAMAEGAAYIWLLNNDTIPAPDTLNRLVAAAEADPRIGLASPVIRNTAEARAIDSCGGLVHMAPLNFETTTDLVIAARWMQTDPDRIWLAGTSLLIRRALIETIGTFDGRFFAYWEDNDYSLRSINAGFRNVVVLQAEVAHESAQPGAESQVKPPYFYYYMARNELLLLRKHGGILQNARSLLWSIRRQWRLLARLERDSSFRLTGRFPSEVDLTSDDRAPGHYPAARKAIWQGLRDGLLGRGGPWRQG